MIFFTRRIRLTGCAIQAENGVLAVLFAEQANTQAQEQRRERK